MANDLGNGGDPPPLPPPAAGGGGGDTAAAAAAAPNLPGPKTIIRPQYAELVHILLQLIDSVRPHVHVTGRRGSPLWQQVHDRFMDRVDGAAREYAMWTTDGWKELRRSALAAIIHYSDIWVEQDAEGNTPSNLAQLAHNLATEIENADTASRTNAQRRAEGEAARQSRLAAAQGAMGLGFAGRGVDAPSLLDTSSFSAEPSVQPKKTKAKGEPKPDSYFKPDPESEEEYQPTPPHKNKARAAEPVMEENLEPLSFEEQEALSDSINLLPDHLLPGAMLIIREADFVNDDDDEIDLDNDQLDTKTQRKLQKFVMEVRLRGIAHRCMYTLSQ